MSNKLSVHYNGGRYTKHRGVTDCDQQTCDYVLTYRVSDGDIAQFEMTATAGWVAVGFSSDDRMVGINYSVQTVPAGKRKIRDGRNVAWRAVRGVCQYGD